MPTKTRTLTKKKAIRKAAPILGVAATAGLFSMMGTAMALAMPAQPVSQITLSDDAGITLAALHGHRHSHTRRHMGKGTA